MARRSEHSLEEIKAMVLNAAETIITDEGFAALTIRKIAMEMGYTVGSVYMVFTSRAELILHVNARTLEDINTYLQSVSSINGVEAWLKAYLQYARTNPDRWRMIFTTDANSLPDWYQAHTTQLFQQFAAHFTVTSAEQNPQAIHALWQGIHGVCLLSTNNDAENSVLLLLKIFLSGWNNCR